MNRFTTINKIKAIPSRNRPSSITKNYCGKNVGISYRKIFYMRYIAYFPALLFSRRSPKKLRNVLSIKRSRRQTKEMSAHA